MGKKIVFSNNPLFSGPSYKEREDSGIPYREVQLSAIERDPNQPRVQFDEAKLSELCTSIKTYGVLSPILIRPSQFPGKYILVAGERRYRASMDAGLSSIPAIIDSTEDKTGERTLAIQLVENLQRADLSPLEKSYAISALKETHSLSVRSVADHLGISKSAVQRSLDLLDLPDDLLNALREGASESKILLLAKVKDSKERAKMLSGLGDITRDSLRSKVTVKKPKKAKAISAEDRRISEEIQRAIGLKVSLQRGKGSNEGKLSINFHSEEDLQIIFRKLIQ